MSLKIVNTMTLYQLGISMHSNTAAATKAVDSFYNAYVNTVGSLSSVVQETEKISWVDN